MAATAGWRRRRHRQSGRSGGRRGRVILFKDFTNDPATEVTAGQSRRWHHDNRRWIGVRNDVIADGTPATALLFVSTIDVGPDGWVYLFDNGNYKTPPAFLNAPTRVSSDDGVEYYEFDARGKHLRTLHALTGAVLYQFAYNASGRLTAITDGDGLITTIHRSAAGSVTSVEAPFGQLTQVSQDSNGWLASLIAPGGRPRADRDGVGLLTRLVDATAASGTSLTTPMAC